MLKRIFLIVSISLTAIAIPVTVVLLLKRTQIQKEAAVEEGLTTVTLQPQTGTHNLEDSFDVQININTAGIGVSVITVYLTYGFEETPELEVVDADDNSANGTQLQSADIPQLNYITNDVTVDEPSKKVIIRLAAMIADPEEPYANTSDTLFGTITFKALSPVESRTVSFDQELSRITHAQSAEDILLIPTNGFYTITGEVTPAVPKIIGFSPASGKIGTTVAIEGENFNAEQGESQVKFAETEASEIDNWSDKNISAKVPEGAETGKISVTTSGGTATSSEDFEVLEDEEPPEPPEEDPIISAFTPQSGNVGTQVTITGDHFGDEQGSSKIKFNDVEATQVTIWTNVLLETRVPSEATTGKISVVTDWGTAISDENFDVTQDTGTPPEDVTPPTITNISASQIDESSATISWNTNEASSSQVEYGLSTEYGNSTVKDMSLVSGHSLVLTALSASTTYHFRVKSEDASSNLATSSDQTFTTTAPAPPPDTTAPVISNIEVNEITSSSAKITWTTDEPATTQLEYGTTTLYGNSAPQETTLTGEHTVVLNNLNANTAYHYRAISQDGAGNQTVSEDYTFITSEQPQGGPGDDDSDDVGDTEDNGEELPETGIEDYTHIVLLFSGFLILLGLTIPKFAISFSHVSKKRRFKKFEHQILNSHER